MNLFLEAVLVQRDLALLAHEQRLHVLLSVQRAHLAVTPLGLSLLVLLGGDGPVVEPVEPLLRLQAGLPAILGGGAAVLVHHVDAKLPQEIQVGLLSPCHLHTQPPSVDCTGAQGPRVDREVPLLDPISNPVAGHAVVDVVHAAHARVVLLNHLRNGDLQLLLLLPAEPADSGGGLSRVLVGRHVDGLVVFPRH